MIYFLVPTYGRLEVTKKFLSSLHASVESKYLVIIIDDHPQKVTLKNINQNSNVQVVSSEKELWWVGSINLGIKLLFKKYDIKNDDIVVFSNNDVVINKNSFNKLHQELKKNTNQIIHPRTFDQDMNEVSSGSKILSIFPYITKHPKNFKDKKANIEMGTARFLMMIGHTLKKIGYVNPDLMQYGGDNDFTLSAKVFHNINTFILRDAFCELDDTETGIKNSNIGNIRVLYKSFFNIKSPNNIHYRYKLFKKFYGKVGAFFITLSLTLNSIIKFTFRANAFKKKFNR
jgi:hypothetical protein